MDKIIDWLAKACAIVGGLTMVTITLITTGSVLSRWLFNSPLLGDSELVEFAMAIAVACFLPLCQWKRGNIIVDFFTTSVKPSTRVFLDRLGALLIGIMMALLAWRTAAGAISQHEAGSTTMLMGLPEWTAFVAMVPPLALTAWIGLYMAVTHRQAPDSATTADGADAARN